MIISSDATASLDEAAFSRPVRILPLGDSITMVQANTSYRYPLWRRLIEYGVDVDFLGTLSDTQRLSSAERPSQYRDRSYDGDHEGHWGWTADEVLAQLDNWLDQYEAPDITLIHLGTNDSFRGQDNADTYLEISNIIKRLRLRNPAMLIVVAKIFPGFWGDVRPLNLEIERLAAPGVLIADCYTGIDLQEDTDDYAHPNASGGEKMAAAWWKVLQVPVAKWRQSYERWREGYGQQLPWDIDSDADGWINYLEYGARTHPLNPQDRPTPGWRDTDWQVPAFDSLRTGERVIQQHAPSPDGPFLNGTPANGGAAFFRWLVRPE